MAFDENFHLGVIRLYAHHLTPFWQAQPAGADVFGAVFRDPSYLYHWLMSFPYRLISIFTDSQTAAVLWLRFINIGLFAAALPLYRRLLLKTGAPRTLVHLCLAVFVLIPITPLLAAQINYDNLLLPLTALTLLMTVNLSQGLRGKKRLDINTLLILITVVTLTCLVKYAFLPIALVVAAYLAVLAWRTRANLDLTPLKPTSWLLLALLALSLGLLTQRYGVNLVRYHKPVPDCAETLSVQRCQSYGPWIRDHYLETHKPAAVTTSPPTFTADWFYGMWMRSFFAVDGPGSNFQTRGPLILPGIGAIVFASVSFLVTLVSLPRVFRTYNKQVLSLFLVVMAAYVGALWFDGYQSFLQTGQPVAINGRYLLPIMPLLLVTLGLGVNMLLVRREALKLAFTAAALICMLWGGGALTYILRSNDAWYWPNQTVHDANHAVRNSLGPITPGYHSPNEFMGRN